MKNNFIVSSSEKRMILEMHNLLKPKSVLKEQSQEEVKSIVYASTSPESMPNTKLLENGLVIPEELKSKYPNIENVVFRSTVSSLISTGNLSTFKPVRITKMPMDVLMVGGQGGDYQQGGVTPQGGVSFFSNSNDNIDASHNGLLVLLRAMDKYGDAGKPQDIKFILKMGQQERYSVFMDLKNINSLNLNQNKIGSFENIILASLIPDGKFAADTYKKMFSGKTEEQRIAKLNETLGFVTYYRKTFPFTNTTSPKIDFASWVNTYYGKDFNDPSLVSTYNQIFKTAIDHFNAAIKDDLYTPWFRNTGIVIPEIDAIIANNAKLTPQPPAPLATAIMTSASSEGQKSKPVGGSNASSTNYKIGKSTQ